MKGIPGRRGSWSSLYNRLSRKGNGTNTRMAASRFNIMEEDSCLLYDAVIDSVKSLAAALCQCQSRPWPVPVGSGYGNGDPMKWAKDPGSCQAKPLAAPCRSLLTADCVSIRVYVYT